MADCIHMYDRGKDFIRNHSQDTSQRFGIQSYTSCHVYFVFYVINRWSFIFLMQSE